MKIPKRLCTLCKADHGAALVELALVTPMLLLLVFGAIDFGRAYYVNIELVNAAHAGAEYGSLYPSVKADIITAATKPNEPNVTFNTPTVTSGCECSDGSLYIEGCSPVPACVASAGPPAVGGNAVYRVKVTTSAVYKTFVPWTGIPSTFNFSRTATIRGIHL
jgi:Flp pilus assembly protein TadG